MIGPNRKVDLALTCRMTGGLTGAKHVFASLVLITFAVTGSAQIFRSKVWFADNGDGSYRNPILYADYSDPDVIRVGDNFYLTSSSFNSALGLPILHSKDLVNWTIIGHALTRQTSLNVFKLCSIWPP